MPIVRCSCATGGIATAAAHLAVEKSLEPEEDVVQRVDDAVQLEEVQIACVRGTVRHR